MSNIFDRRRAPATPSGSSKQRVFGMNSQGMQRKKQQDAQARQALIQGGTLGYKGYQNKDEIMDWAKDKYRSVTGQAAGGDTIAKAENALEKHFGNLLEPAEGVPVVDASPSIFSSSQAVVDPAVDMATDTATQAVTDATTQATTDATTQAATDSAASGSGGYLSAGISASQGNYGKAAGQAAGAALGSYFGPWGSMAGSWAGGQVGGLLDGGGGGGPVGPAPQELSGGTGQQLAAAPLQRTNLFEDVPSLEEEELNRRTMYGYA